MVGKKKANELGRSLVKSRFSNTTKKKVDENMLHTTELKDGYDWGRLNLQSVTEEDSFQAFLRTAELAGTEFQAEKLNIQFINPKSNVGILTATERFDLEEIIKDKKGLMKIPRRPLWNKDTTPEQLHLNENTSFLEWRRDLALLQEKEGLVMTPYEKNLEFWRQLWRVVEKSDVVVQILDSRNPLLFRSEDLELYVKEVDPNKQNVLLLNKADFLTESQRTSWAEYFDSQKITIAFFTALEPEVEVIEEESSDEINEDDSSSEDSEDSQDGIENTSKEIKKNEQFSLNEIKERVEVIDKELNEVEKVLDACVVPQMKFQQTPGKNDSQILSRLDLVEFFKQLCKNEPSTADKEIVTIGLTGYPNVGKSSTINALLQEKKVSVSATPGKTKHFQTLFLDKDIMLCDCCGLVMPSFCLTKADMVVNGILPIDQMRDHVPPVNLMCTLIPRHILEDTYGILIAKPLEGDDPNRPPFAEEFLLAYAYNRGFMTANGQPDQARAARYALKDYANGKLRYCFAPPGMIQEDFHTFPERKNTEQTLTNLPPRQQRNMRIATGKTSQDVDSAFFINKTHSVHVQGRNDFMNFSGSQSSIASSSLSQSEASKLAKPWKHIKREKKEKLRNKYVHHDMH